LDFLLLLSIPHDETLALLFDLQFCQSSLLNLLQLLSLPLFFFPDLSGHLLPILPLFFLALGGQLDFLLILLLHLYRLLPPLPLVLLQHVLPFIYLLQ